MSAHPRSSLALGWSRGWLEYRKSFSTKQDAFNYFGLSGLFLLAAWSLRDAPAPGGGVTVGTTFLASVIGFIVAMGGVVTVAQVLASEREDGTLLRAKSLPRGMRVYLIAKAVHMLMVTMTNTLLVLVPSLFLLDGFGFAGVASVWTLVWVVVLGLAATVPVGAVLGALVRSPRTTMGLLMIPIMGISMVSGIFVPILAMPGWAQMLAQVFPVYWVGLGTRSAFLPDWAVAGEIGQSWRHMETVGVLGVWAVVGMAIAPALLRRVARRESGSRLAAARERAMQQGT